MESEGVCPSSVIVNRAFLPQFMMPANTEAIRGARRIKRIWDFDNRLCNKVNFLIDKAQRLRTYYI